MKNNRFFTKPNKDIFHDILFERRVSEIRNPDGELIFRAKDVEVPSFWSYVASDILAQKYFRKAGIPKFTKKVPEKGIPDWLCCSIPCEESLEKLPQEERFERETSIKQVVHRLAGTWTYWGFKNNYFDTEQDAQIFYDEIRYMLTYQMAAPNSPQWFNTGLHWAYGIEGPAQGHYYVNPDTKKVTSSKSAYYRPQPHACFIQSVNDDLVNEGGIMDLWLKEARLFKYGSGTGSNFSGIRGKGEKLSGGGSSSGLMSFLKIGDVSAGSIKSGGTTRRAAKMVCLDIDHPDIEEFISWKLIEEQKVACLVAGSDKIKNMISEIFDSVKGCDQQPSLLETKNNPKLSLTLKKAVESRIPHSYIQKIFDIAKQGYKEIVFDTYNIEWDSKAYQTVSGQNSNNSVRMTNSFLKAVEEDRDWNLINRIDKSPAKTIKAKKLFDTIAYAAWSCADPGVQFDTTINEWNTCAKDGRINASNPCSEYMFLDDTACNLASLNLMRFYSSEKNQLNVDAYTYAIRLWTIVLEISVLMAQFPSTQIAELSYKYRTLGLGFANLGSLLMASGIPYNSHKANAVTGSISAILTGVAYKTSAEMAKEFGAFQQYKENQDHMLRVIANHRRSAYDVDKEEYEGLSIVPQGIKEKHVPKYLLKAARSAWDEALELGKQYGYRNAQASVIAPTGTIGLIMDCDTTGIEPDFALVKYKKLAGGGYFKIVNKTVPIVLNYLGYTSKQIQDINTYILGTATFEGVPYINKKTLQKKGFPVEVIDKLEQQLNVTFDIRFIFNKWSLGGDIPEGKSSYSSRRIREPLF